MQNPTIIVVGIVFFAKNYGLFYKKIIFFANFGLIEYNSNT